MFKHVYSLVLITCFFLKLSYAQHCSSNNRYTEIDFFNSSQITSVLDVKYGEALDRQNVLQDLTLDIYYPSFSVDTSNNRPFVLLIHGGGFISGDKSSLQLECEEFAKKGFVCATMSYRLGYDPNIVDDDLKAAYRSQQDAHAAMRYMVSEASTYKIDTSWLFVGGESAGAITALGLNYVTQAEWNVVANNISNDLGDLETSGNLLTNTFSIQGIFNNWGNTFTQTLSPSEYAPMIAFHGELDNILPIDASAFGTIGSRTIYNTLIANNVCSSLTIDTDGAHGVYTDAPGTIFRIGKASCFFKSLFCSTCSSESTTSTTPANCSQQTLTNELADGINKRITPLNPFTDKLSFSNLNGDEHFTLTNALNQVIYKGKNIQNQNFSNLAKGLYICVVSSKNTKEIFKLIKS